MNAPFTQILNPTNEQRQEMIRNSLEVAGRPEDYENIVRLLSPPPDITNYAQPGSLKGVKNRGDRRRPCRSVRCI